MSDNDREKSEMEKSQPTTTEMKEKQVTTTEPSSTTMSLAPEDLQKAAVAGQKKAGRGTQIDLYNSEFNKFNFIASFVVAVVAAVVAHDPRFIRS
jgi:hypothetical protein